MNKKHDRAPSAGPHATLHAIDVHADPSTDKTPTSFLDLFKEARTIRVTRPASCPLGLETVKHANSPTHLAVESEVLHGSHDSVVILLFKHGGSGREHPLLARRLATLNPTVLKILARATWRAGQAGDVRLVVSLSGIVGIHSPIFDHILQAVRT